MVTHDIGGRVAQLRRRRGLTQQQLAEAIPLSYSYVSLIEAGKRTPRKRVVTLLAEQLGCSEDYLFTGRETGAVRTLELELRFAELALRSGDAAAARDRFAVAYQRATAMGGAYDCEELEARWGLVRADMALGRLRSALRECEMLAGAVTLPPSVDAADVRIALCRVYMECGDVNRAIDVGEAVIAADAGETLALREKRAEVISMLAACYYERGDLTRAELLLDGVIEAASDIGSLPGRAAGWWNAAVIAEARGDIETAMALTESALAAYGELDRARAVAMLKSNLVHLRLEIGTARAAETLELAEQAMAELREASAPATAIAIAAADLAYSRLATGDAASAVRAITDVTASLPAESPLHTAVVLAARAEAELQQGAASDALRTARSAAAELELVSPTAHRAKETIAAVAELLLRLRKHEEGIALYRRLAGPIVRASEPSGPRVIHTVRDVGSGRDGDRRAAT
jgi:transcriptional regulator with XRE-family HTH domain/lipopolysaccharide biosynthesis regulator YciM